MKSLKSPSSSFSNSQAPEQTPQLAYRPFGGQTQKASFTPVTQADVENEAFAEEKMEVTGLELQAKHRTITPEGQERLTVLQAKMDQSLNSRLEKATRFGHNFANIPVRRPDTPTPIQAKLTIGEPGDRYEQEADQTARQVIQRIHQPKSEKLQREELPDEEELQMKPEGSIQREELLEEEDVQMKSLGETASLQRQELPEEEELQMKPLGTSSQIVNEVKSPNKPLGHDISRISLRRPQTKLTVNQPGDIYEQEADSVAQLVMQRMSEPVQSIQREALPEEEDQLQMKSLADSVTPLVQRQGGGRTSATSELETSIQQARGNGQPLADDIKQPMEQAFGADFGGVRVHTDAQSNSLNESIQARAFTTGQDVFFRQGEYSPGSDAGKELLAHELTHVVQQNGSAVQPKSLHVAPKENKLQTKALPTTCAGHGLAIQLRENFQKPSDEDNHKNLESKTDTENGEQQNQATTEKHQATPTPPNDGGNAATDPPPTKKVGAAVTQKQVEVGGNQPKEPESKDTKANTEKVDSQQQAESKGGLPGADVGKGAADLPGGNAGKAIAALPGANVANATVDGKKAPISPEDDPAFQAVVGTTKEVAGLEKKHPPANSKAQEAQAAAQPPGNEVDSKAQVNQVGEMQQAPTPRFDAAAFKAKLMERIADMAPKNLEEADNFKNNNKLDIERAQQIADLINAILDAIGAIASGAIDQAIKGVENALAKSLPVVISFLASLLGLDGIAGKIQGIFKKLRKPMEKAVDWIIDKGAKAANKVGKKFNKSKVGKKANAVKESAQKKKEAAQEWANKKKEAAQQRFEEKKQAINNRLEEKKNQLINTKAGKKLTAANEAAHNKLDALEEKRQAFNNKIEAAKEWPAKKLEALENRAEELRGTGKDKFKQSKLGQKFESIKDRASKKKQAVKDKYDKATNKIKSKLEFSKNKDQGKEVKPKDKISEVKVRENKAKAEKQHELLAQQAISELEKIDGRPKDYKTINAEKQAQAQQIEKSYTQRLEKGIKLTVHFDDATRDQKDGDLDFKVIIAPNTTTGSGSIPVATYKVSSAMRQKILWGASDLTTPQRVIGGHFLGIVGHPNYAVEKVGISSTNPTCIRVKFYKLLPSGSISNIKSPASTLFPKGWSKSNIITAINQVANNPSSVRSQAGALYHQGTVKGIYIEVVIRGGQITAGYPL